MQFLLFALGSVTGSCLYLRSLNRGCKGWEGIRDYLYWRLPSKRARIKGFVIWVPSWYGRYSHHLPREEKCFLGRRGEGGDLDLGLLEPRDGGWNHLPGVSGHWRGSKNSFLSDDSAYLLRYPSQGIILPLHLWFQLPPLRCSHFSWLQSKLQLLVIDSNHIAMETWLTLLPADSINSRECCLSGWPRFSYRIAEYCNDKNWGLDFPELGVWGEIPLVTGNNLQFLFKPFPQLFNYIPTLFLSSYLLFLLFANDWHQVSLS